MQHRRPAHLERSEYRQVSNDDSDVCDGDTRAVTRRWVPRCFSDCFQFRRGHTDDSQGKYESVPVDYAHAHLSFLTQRERGILSDLIMRRGPTGVFSLVTAPFDPPGVPSMLSEEDEDRIDLLYAAARTPCGDIGLDEAARRRLLNSHFTFCLSTQLGRHGMGNEGGNIDPRYCLSYPSGNMLYRPTQPNPFSSDGTELMDAACSYIYWKLPTGESDYKVVAIDRRRLVRTEFSQSFFYIHIVTYMASCLSDKKLCAQWESRVGAFSSKTGMPVPTQFVSCIADDGVGNANDRVYKMITSGMDILLQANIIPGTRDNPLVWEDPLTDTQIAFIHIFVFVVNWGILLKQRNAFGGSGGLQAITDYLSGVSKMREVEAFYESEVVTWYNQKVSLESRGLRIPLDFSHEPLRVRKQVGTEHGRDVERREPPPSAIIDRTYPHLEVPIVRIFSLYEEM